MIIHPPKIIDKGSYCLLETVFETQNRSNVLWYKVNSEHSAFLTTENCDSAVVGLLVLAMKNNEDIYIKGSISSKLHYALNTYLIRALNLSNDSYKIIKIIPDKLNDKKLNTTHVTATGLSCGIDSFSTIASHINLEKNYKLDYLTYFNAGSHGVFKGEKAQAIYDHRFLNARECAKELGLPLITIDTNIFDLVAVPFQKLHSIYHFSCVLVIQNLVSTYYYASAFRFDHFKLNQNDTSDWDMILLNYLQTESVELYSSMAYMTRLERTQLVSKYKLSYNYLDVCTNNLNSDKLNCSKCEKCLRTLLTFESINELENYSKVFDLKVYKEHKKSFIYKLINTKNRHQIDQELFTTLNAKGFITKDSYTKAKIMRIEGKIKAIKKSLKSIFFSRFRG